MVFVSCLLSFDIQILAFCWAILRDVIQVMFGIQPVAQEFLVDYPNEVLEPNQDKTSEQQTLEKGQSNGTIQSKIESK